MTNNDWRLQGQEQYLRGALLHWSTYHPRTVGNDHDHCEFCFVKFMEAAYAGTMQEGYTTDDGHRWICRQCFNDFKERFGFVISA